MPFIGRQPSIGNFQVCDAISVVNGQAAYTMQVGGVNVSPESANHMLVSLNGILQAPTSSFTVSGSTITFALNLDLGVPSDNTVSLAKLTATGTKDATTFLRGDNTFAAAGLNGWSEDGANNNLLPASSSAGIYLGTTSATAANLLDDYEEGTFTPAVNQGTINNVGSHYIKIGNKVTIWSSINGFSNRTSTETLEVSSLPFSIASQNQNRVVGSIVMNYSDKLVHAAYTRNASEIAFYISIAGSFVPLKFNDLNNSGSNIIFTATYEAA